MSAFSHREWTVFCDHADCLASVSSSELLPRYLTAESMRAALKRRGWAVGIPAGWGKRQLDYCPAHKHDATEGET